MLTTGPILKVEPSPCYYLGNITIPAGASVCYGWTPGTNLSVLMPCDSNGCCFSQVTGTPGTPYYTQHVLSSTPCPPSPVIPPTANIVWSCDILGGGVASFSVPFTPDVPTVCQMTCFEGSGAPAAKHSSAGIVADNNLSTLRIYPNPVNDQLNISFNYAKADEQVTVEIYNSIGQLMSHSANKTIDGKQTITVNTQKYTPGTYTCTLKYGPNIITQRFVK
ncbi:MAG: T9SS type A sorting domain-containing protein [Bacteroidetes bacterium]|nr:T9SS type A sorting domain-containing protein [Bacteroidota bacterium]